MDDSSNADYDHHLDLCVRFDTWRLKTACSLIAGGLPEYAGKPHPNEEAYAAIYEAAVSCANQSLSLVDERSPVADYRVFPSVFAAWALEFGFKPYSRFKPKVDASINEDKWSKAADLEDIKVLFKEATGHRLPSNIAAKLRAFDERVKSKYRCRGLADYFWSQDESLTKADIVKNPDFLRFGCGGKSYGLRQMCAWIADLNPSPLPGRPKGR